MEREGRGGGGGCARGQGVGQCGLDLAWSSRGVHGLISADTHRSNRAAATLLRWYYRAYQRQIPLTPSIIPMCPALTFPPMTEPSSGSSPSGYAGEKSQNTRGEQKTHQVKYALSTGFHEAEVIRGRGRTNGVTECQAEGGQPRHSTTFFFPTKRRRSRVYKTSTEKC